MRLVAGMEQLLAHLAGDYLLQTTWMAQNKVKSWFAAAIHAAVYTLPFLLLASNTQQIVVIFATHAVIDRYRLATLWTRVLWSGKMPDWLGGWLIILYDNTMHLGINFAALALL